jgi:hypothetical protein
MQQEKSMVAQQKHQLRERKALPIQPETPPGSKFFGQMAYFSPKSSGILRENLE